MEPNNKKLNLDWSDVEEALSENSTTGYKIAVLETDKVFRDYLTQFKYLGSDPLKKIKTLAKLLNKKRELLLLQTVKEKIIEEKKFDLSRDDTKEIISEYWQIIKVLDEFNRRTRRTKKFWLRLENSSFLSFLKISVISFAAIIFGIKFFSTTFIGREIAASAIKIADLLFWKLIIALSAITILFVVWQITKRFRKT